LFDFVNLGGDAVKSRGQMIERKIEVLEDMAAKVRRLILLGKIKK
jgi:hypothetical protein